MLCEALPGLPAGDGVLATLSVVNLLVVGTHPLPPKCSLSFGRGRELSAFWKTTPK